MKKTTTTAASGQSTTATKKKRIFYPAHYYVVDDENHVLKIVSNPKELEGLEYEDTDTILIGVHPTMMFKSSKKVTKIILDFTKNELTLEGSGATIAKVDYPEPATYTLEPEDLKDWEDMLEDCKKSTKDFVMIGTPPIEGELLNVE